MIMFGRMASSQSWRIGPVWTITRFRDGTMYTRWPPKPSK